MTRRDQPRRTVPSLCAILIALVTSLGTTQAAYAGTITIEWDRSPDPTVVGYRVSVGTAPGDYTETFDVGSATSFVYQAQDTRLYYLAVASYAEGPLVGPLSAPVSATPAPDARSFYQSLWRDIAPPKPVGASLGVALPARILRRSTTAVESAAVPPSACWTGIPGCLSVRAVTRHRAEITSIAVSTDNRLFFIESGQRIGVIVSGALQTQPVLARRSAAIVFEQLTLDSAFGMTGLLYVGETETYPDGRRDFRVVQYRLYKNRAEDRTVVTTITLPSSGRATFAVSSSGHLYVTAPADDSPWRTSGSVLRVYTDGTVPVEQDGSAVIGAGYATPTAATFDEYAQRLWIAGIDHRNQSAVTTIGGPATQTIAPLNALSTVTDRQGRTSLFVTSALGILGTARLQPDGTMTDAGELRIGSSRVRTVTATPTGELFVAVATESVTTDPSFSILRLTPLR